MHEHETVVVTGASAGVGRAVAVRFARDGCRVGLLARGRAGLEGASREVRDAGGQAHPVVTDVADPAAVEAAADEVTDRFGDIDVWVNNAMVTVYGRFWDLSPEEFQRVVEVTFLGSAWGLQAALRRMRPRDEGTIVQVGSALGSRGIPLQSAYCASKHALNGMLDSVRTELASSGSAVHLGIVQLPALDTPQFTWGRSKLDAHPQPVPPIFRPEVAADAIHHVARTRRREAWVGSSTVQTILGSRLSTAAMDTYLARTGVDAQRADHLDDTGRADNLFAPADDHEDAGTAGPFGDRSRDHSAQWSLDRHRAGILASLAVAVSGALAAWGLARPGRPARSPRADRSGVLA
ncbi:SDR family oxidoreductase [Salsipaludibacter albus]|uniref:SDR family oxidoreductase n=1 Tax=Salsipaludibacter albus TaxID=2849650 RepID=UPI001EE44812|nr:SDR family oxidoreductase [Salsipaludibacter albus]MBY5161383.1 SDR family oxidoreductase [Salsipaludibacter albus]